jgi:hypothetical protein
MNQKQNQLRIPNKHKKRPGTKKEYDLKICTWNVRTLYRLGAKPELENALEKTKADITAIQEMCLNGKECRDYYTNRSIFSLQNKSVLATTHAADRANIIKV